MKIRRQFITLTLVMPVLAAFGAVGRPSLPDVRVGPLVATHWNQASNTGAANTGVPCYNYYTPNSYKCGCSATAMAQLLAYWRYPSSISARAFPCEVDGQPRELTTRSGAYDWANMADDPSDETSSDVMQAIGRLTYDCAVSLRSMFAAGGTDAYGVFAFDPLRGMFGYANAIGYMGAPNVEEMDPAEIRETILACLDYGSPVLVTVSDSEQGVGHVVLIDGYGYDAGKEFYHVNFGLSNREGEDAWYPLLDAHVRKWHFDIIDGLIYNVFPQATGDILSGRVVDSLGQPLENVEVKAVAKDGVTANVTTDAKGIFSFVLQGDETYTVKVGRLSKNVKLRKAVSADVMYLGGLPRYTKPGSLGNTWGCDFTVTSPEDLLPPEEDPLGAFKPSAAISGKYPFCGVVRDGKGNVKGTITLKIGKASKKGVAKVSGTIVQIDGKKVSIKSTSFETTEWEPSRELIVIKKFGLVDLAVGEKGFAATITCDDGTTLTAEPADITSGLAMSEADFSVNLSELPSMINGAPVLSECLPTGPGVVITVDKRGKWVLPKTATPKYKKIAKKDEFGKRYYEYELQGLDDPKKLNVSGLKLTYTKTAATFKGSFNLYCKAGTEAAPKIKKYAYTVTGLVADGKGVGVATCKTLKQTIDVKID